MNIIETTIADKIGMTAALQDAHWQESARNKHLMVLKPDVARYQALEENGAILGLIAYDGEEIVGYSINIISPHLHYVDVVCCHNDVLFLSEKHRRSRIGLRLIDETERMAKLRGCHLMLWHAKENTSLDLILRRRDGCKVQEIMHSKEL